jgi:D-3-phosphoglycerate dehydrogenase / 2-oxoglutarate reductase
MAYRVLIPQDIVEEGKAWLRARGYEIKMGSGITPEAIAADVADCEAILARTAPFPARVLEAGKKLRVIGRHGIGYDNIDVARAAELGIWVTNTPEANAGSVAEFALGCIIALARNFIRSDRETRAGNWEIRNRMTGSDLEGKVLGIVGLGRIGRRLARKAALGLEMKVVGYDPYLSPEAFPEHVTPVKNWEELFASSDYISLHLPGGADNKGIVGRKEFSLMRKTACLINASRGDVVNEAELVEALKNGIIAGAALDVFAQEPPEENNPLFTLDNVLLTPHNAALTREAMLRMALSAAQGIDEVLSGKRPAWPVNEPAARSPGRV